MMRWLTLIALLGMLGAVSAWKQWPAANEELVRNGGFEVPQLHYGSWQGFHNELPGSWYASRKPGRVPVIEVQNNAAGQPLEGKQFVELDSEANSAIYQELRTEPDASYQLEFAFAARPGTSPEDNRLKVMWDGYVLDKLSADGRKSEAIQWEIHRYRMKASGPVTRLMFVDQGISNSRGTYIDAVSVRRID